MVESKSDQLAVRPARQHLGEKAPAVDGGAQIPHVAGKHGVEVIQQLVAAELQLWLLAASAAHLGADLAAQFPVQGLDALWKGSQHAHLVAARRPVPTGVEVADFQVALALSTGLLCGLLEQILRSEERRVGRGWSAW